MNGTQSILSSHPHRPRHDRGAGNGRLGNVLLMICLGVIAGVTVEAAMTHWELPSGWTIPLFLTVAAISFMPVARWACVFLVLLMVMPWEGALFFTLVSANIKGWAILIYKHRG